MTEWPTQSGVRSFFGEPGSPQATAGMVDLAYPMKIAWDKSQVIRRFRCHAKVGAPLERIFQKMLAHYGAADVSRLALDIFGGCYNYRPMRGGKSWSMHAFGIAVDLDPENNQLKWGRDRAKFAKPEYVPFWNIVESEGAVSLGRVANRDFMHFQFARL
ncbi:M15 family metallopeptidase [Rhizobium sp. 007]|uniref:M15 family metallopeptidase n=1 Tax=Rhizobium sp. 007 TaxID=2785056 RepID=UPI00188E07C3|nr:M15 family metallopeptidase [Rhizobium sp. 007]QPB18736.1 M15 family metallopeptidase [Rhizobium sp. 007]